ncbi:MAG: TetR/AcrR family transcriptional regulator [Myxococcota bacterium]|nr:TetR/AcrR family transcriptional regulator [Myxococcota bacterium]
MTAPLPEPRQERRERILRAALEIGLKRGLAATHMDEIAENAGVSKGTLYNFFESREQLLVEAVLFSYTGAVVLHEDVEDESTPPRLRLRRLIDSLAGSFDHVVLQFPMATQAWSLAAPGTEVHTRLGEGLNEIFMGYRKRVADLLSVAQKAGDLQADLDVNTLAAVWVATYNGLLYRASFDDRSDDSLSTKEGVTQALSWLLETACPPPEDASS